MGFFSKTTRSQESDVLLKVFIHLYGGILRIRKDMTPKRMAFIRDRLSERYSHIGTMNDLELMELLEINKNNLLFFKNATLAKGYMKDLAKRPENNDLIQSILSDLFKIPLLGGKSLIPDEVEFIKSAYLGFTQNPAQWFDYFKNNEKSVLIESKSPEFPAGSDNKSTHNETDQKITKQPSSKKEERTNAEGNQQKQSNSENIKEIGIPKTDIKGIESEPMEGSITPLGSIDGDGPQDKKAITKIDRRREVSSFNDGRDVCNQDDINIIDAKTDAIHSNTETADCEVEDNEYPSANKAYFLLNADDEQDIKKKGQTKLQRKIVLSLGEDENSSENSEEENNLFTLRKARLNLMIEDEDEDYEDEDCEDENEVDNDGIYMDDAEKMFHHMYLGAMVDNKMTDHERDLLLGFGQRMHISQNKMNKLIQDAAAGNIMPPPKTEKNKIRVLCYTLCIMTADGNISNAEQLALLELSTTLGIENEKFSKLLKYYNFLITKYQRIEVEVLVEEIVKRIT